jgi:hypothetical protein
MIPTGPITTVRALLAGAVLVAHLPEPAAQQAPELPRLLEAVWGAPAHCPAALAALNKRLNDPRAEDLLAIGRHFEAGECVLRDEPRASQFYGEASRRGSAEASRRLAALFGAGRGVPQSYANAGAWLAGKGGTDETIEPWDYSVGVAFTLIVATLDQLRFPKDAWPAGLEVSLALDADARQSGKLWWRFVGGAPAQVETLRAPLGEAMQLASGQAFARLAPVVPKYLVPARVTLPIRVQRNGDDRFIVSEHDPLLH